MTTRDKVDAARETARKRLRVDDYVTAGQIVAQIVALTGLGKDRVTKLLQELVARGEAVCLDEHATKGHPRRYTTPAKASAA